MPGIGLQRLYMRHMATAFLSWVLLAISPLLLFSAVAVLCCFSIAVVFCCFSIVAVFCCCCFSVFFFFYSCYCFYCCIFMQLLFFLQTIISTLIRNLYEYPSLIILNFNRNLFQTVINKFTTISLSTISNRLYTYQEAHLLIHSEIRMFYTLFRISCSLEIFQLISRC